MKDPVCGMTVTMEATHHAVYEGNKYYFCSVACRDKFSAAPGQYLIKGGSDNNAGCCCGKQTERAPEPAKKMDVCCGKKEERMQRRHPKEGLSLLAVGHATSFTLAISFAFCVIFDLLLPDHAMYEMWQKLLPGFEWLSWKSFILGVLEAYGYGWYFALIWVPVYNFVVFRGEKEDRVNG